MGDGTSNVGLGLLNTSSAFGNTDYRALLKRWLAGMPEEWGFTEENRTGPIRGAALPMGFNRTPHYTSGLLLVGDAAGMVNPFNGEGIAYAMESGEIAARGRRPGAGPAGRRGRRERALHGYPRLLKDAYGGYYTLGPGLREADRQPRGHEVRHPARPAAPGADALHPEAARPTSPTRAAVMPIDRLINAMSKLAPAA